jgi:hypothetical protein
MTSWSRRKTQPICGSLPGAPSSWVPSERKRLRRGLLLLSTVLLVLAVAPAATAKKPMREIIPAPDDMVFTDQCAFPVLAHIEGSEIDTTFFDKANNPVKLLGVFPGNTLTLTNLDTGKSITLGATASFHARLEHDGSEIDMVTGQGPWVTGNPITGDPGIWYQDGRVSATFDAEGNTTSINSSGTLVNLCPQLAA